MSEEQKSRETSKFDQQQVDETKEAESDQNEKSNDHTEHMSYQEDGSAIYTDPKTKYKYKWCTEDNAWKPWLGSNSCPTEGDQGNSTTETEYYKWDTEKNEWVLKENIGTLESRQDTASPVYGMDDEGHHIYTDKDGAVFFWDVERKAWFPKIDEDFMARYQMSYGFIDNTSTTAAAITTITATNTKLSTQEGTKTVDSVSNLNTLLSEKPSIKRTENVESKTKNATEMQPVPQKRKGGPTEPPSMY